MAAIALYKNKVNGVGGLIDNIIKSSNSLNTQLFTLKNTLQGVDSSASNLQDTIDRISSSSKSEKEKVEDLKKLNRKIDDFIRLAVRNDSFAGSEIKKKKKEFYTKYSYLKPECEKAKSLFKKIADCFSSVKDWCVNMFTDIREKGFFNVVGRFLHDLGEITLWGDVTLKSLAGDILQYAYRSGVYDFLKAISKTGTYTAVFFRKYPFLHWAFPGLSMYGLATELFYSVTLNASMDNDGVYHMRTDCWQQYAHYTTGYDDVFRLGVTYASGGNISVDVHQSYVFWADLNEDGIKDSGEEFIIWSWKGDYVNLGAGAETGIYRVKDGDRDPYTGEYTMDNGEYTYIYAEIDRDYSATMNLDLYYDQNGDGAFSEKEKLYSYQPEEKQWWITGFDPRTQNVRSDDLQAVTYIDFKSYGDKAQIMYEAFKAANFDEINNGGVWSISDEDMTATLIW